MTDPNSSRPLAVPSGRINRLARLGSTAAGIAGSMTIQALGDFGRGARPDMRQLLLTPGNMRRVADELARMRGAAMKVGQLISMDAGDVLPKELADTMARLRNQAHFMPPKQLKQVLIRNWGSSWLPAFERFNVHPIAAASIGQVHRAQLKDGRDVAIKVQYPGIADSIDSDVANVGAIVKLSGLLPKGFELAPYMDEARKQLHEETDYAREGAQLQRFAALLSENDDFAIPMFHEDWSTPEVLTMSFLEGHPIENVQEADQAERNRVANALIRLTLQEVFEFSVTQSDPNFANFRYSPDTGKINLLDFGATRDLDPSLTQSYRKLMAAGLQDDETKLFEAAMDLGFIDGDSHFDADILTMIDTVFKAIRDVGTFDFSDRKLSNQMNAQGKALADAGYIPPPVPMDALYLQRKFGGIFLLASRLGAKLPLRAILEEQLANTA